MNTMLKIQLEAYRCYQLDWLRQHGYWLSDAINAATEDDEDNRPMETLWEQGINGELFVCFEEFCGAEFNDAQYMYSLLNEKDAKLYQIMRVGNWIAEKYSGFSSDAKFDYGVAVPHELLRPMQLCWTWSKEFSLGEILDDVQNRKNELEAAA